MSAMHKRGAATKRNAMTVSSDRLMAGLVLLADGLAQQQAAVVTDGVAVSANPASPLAPPTDLDAAERDYFVEGLPVEIRCHSMGSVDLSDFRTLDLRMLDA